MAESREQSPPASPRPKRISFTTIHRAQPANGVEQLGTELWSAIDIAVLPGYGLFVVACLDQIVRVYTTDGRLVHEMEGHRHSVMGITLVVNDVVASVAKNGSVITWRASDGVMIDKLVLKNEMCNCVEVHGDILLVGTESGNLFAISHLRGRQLKLQGALNSDAHDELPVVAIGVGAGVIVSCSHDWTAAVWHGEQLRWMKSLQFDAEVLSVAIDDDYLVFGCKNGTVYVHTTQGGRRLGVLPRVDICVNDVRLIDARTVVCAGMSGCISFIDLIEMRVLQRVVLQRRAYAIAVAPITPYRICVAGAPALMSSCDLPDGIVADLNEGSRLAEEPPMDEAEEFADAPEEYYETPTKFKNAPEDEYQHVSAKFVNAPLGDSLDADADEYVGEEVVVPTQTIRTDHKEENIIRKTVQNKETEPASEKQYADRGVMLTPKKEIKKNLSNVSKGHPRMKQIASFQRKARMFDSMAKEENAEDHPVPPKKAMSTLAKKAQMFGSLGIELQPRKPTIEVKKPQPPLKKRQMSYEKKVNNLEKVENVLEENVERKLERDRSLSKAEKVELFAAKYEISKKFAPSKHLSATFERKINLFSNPEKHRNVAESDDYDPASMTTEIHESPDEPPTPPSLPVDTRRPYNDATSGKPMWNPGIGALRDDKPKPTPNVSSGKQHINNVGPVSPQMYKTGSRTSQQDSTNSINSISPAPAFVERSVDGVLGKVSTERLSSVERKAEVLMSPVFESSRYDVVENPAIEKHTMLHPATRHEAETRLPSPPGLGYGGKFYPESYSEDSKTSSPPTMRYNSNVRTEAVSEGTKMPPPSVIRYNGNVHIEAVLEQTKLLSPPGLKYGGNVHSDTLSEKASNIFANGSLQRRSVHSPSLFVNEKQMAEKSSRPEGTTFSNNAIKVAKSASRANIAPSTRKQNGHPASEDRSTAPLNNREASEKPVKSPSVKELARKLEKKAAEANKETSSTELDVGPRRSRSNLEDVVARRNWSTGSGGGQWGQPRFEDANYNDSPSIQSKPKELVANYNRLSARNAVSQSYSVPSELTEHTTQRSQSNLTELVANRVGAHESYSGLPNDVIWAEPSPPTTQRSQSNLTETVANRIRAHESYSGLRNDTISAEPSPRTEQRSQSNLTEMVSNRSPMNMPNSRIHKYFGEPTNNANLSGFTVSRPPRPSPPSAKPPIPVHTEHIFNDGVQRGRSSVPELDEVHARSIRFETRPHITEAAHDITTRRSHSDFADVVSSRMRASEPTREQWNGQQQAFDSPEKSDNTAVRAQSNLTEMLASHARTNVPDIPQRSQSNFGESVNDADKSSPYSFESFNKWGVSLRPYGRADESAVSKGSIPNGVRENTRNGWGNSRRSATTHGMDYSNQHGVGQTNTVSGWATSQRSATTHGMDEMGKDLGAHRKKSKNSPRGATPSERENAKHSKDRERRNKGERREKPSNAGKDRARGNTSGRPNRAGQRQKQAQKTSVVRSRSGFIQWSQKVAKSRSTDVLQLSKGQKKKNEGEIVNRQQSDAGLKTNHADEGRKDGPPSFDTKSTTDKLSFETLLQKFNSSFVRRPPRGN